MNEDEGDQRRYAPIDIERLRAENARLQERVEEAEQQVLGMQEEGCAALGLVENIFNGLTTDGTPSNPKLALMAEAAATLMVEATPCGHKALAERRKEALDMIVVPVAKPWWELGAESMAVRLQTVDSIARAAIEEEGTE